MQAVHAVFFSPTGTTKKVVSMAAQTLKKALSLPLKQHDFTTPAGRDQALVFGPHDLVVIGLPVYAGRLPNLLLPFLSTLEGHGARALPLVLFGNRNYDDGLLELGLILENQGFSLLAAGAFVGEHAFSRILGAGRPDEADLKDVRHLALSAAERIKKDGPYPRIWDLLGEAPRDLKPYYTPRDSQGNPINILKVKPRLDAQKCTACGRCVGLCPMGSIHPDDLAQINGICIKCGACIKGCPTGARYYEDPGYLYHQEELEKQYARRAENSVFL